MARVTRAAYYEQAIQILGDEGFGSLTIASLSDALKVTSGSFYHHFGSWNGFVAALVEYWQHEQTERIIELTRPAADPLARFDRLIELAVKLPHAAEAAIRAWANSEPLVADAQRRVDIARTEFVEELLTELLQDARRGRTLGVIVVATYTGLEQLAEQVNATTFKKALYELRDLIASDAATPVRAIRPSTRGRSRRRAAG